MSRIVRRRIRFTVVGWADWIPFDDWESIGTVLPIEATIDSVGRIVVPKPVRDALGLKAGMSLDVSVYGGGLHLVPGGRTARLVMEDGVLVAQSDTVVTDDVLFGLIDSGRR